MSHLGEGSGQPSAKGQPSAISRWGRAAVHEASHETSALQHVGEHVQAPAPARCHLPMPFPSAWFSWPKVHNDCFLEESRVPPHVKETAPVDVDSFHNTC